MNLAVAFIGVVAAMAGVAGSQIGYLWSFEELTSRADLVVIAAPGGTVDTGRRTEQPDAKPAVPVVELATQFKVVALLKADTRATSVDTSGVRLKHYRIDWDEWRRRNPPQPGLPPLGLVNAGSVLDFTQDAGPYLLFLKRGAADMYEPLSGHTFPTDSVFLLRKVGKGAIASPEGHLRSRSRTGFSVRHYRIRSWPEGVEGAPAQTDEVMTQVKYPAGWDEARVKRVLAHYDQQSDDEAVAEDEAAYESTTHTAMEVPVDLVPAVRELLAKRRAG